MRQGIIVAAVTSAILAGGVAAGAQPAPSAPPPMADGMHPPGGPMGGMREEMMHHGDGMRRMRQFALIYPAPDRALSGADVQTIAEAFLLFNGNHSWKITEVSEEPDRVLFAIATPDGTAIAHFAMDRHSGRPERLS